MPSTSIAIAGLVSVVRVSDDKSVAARVLIPNVGADF
jgi:hypothetical protein